MRPLREVVLTPYRYRLGGWDSFLGNLAQFVSVGQELPLRVHGFSPKEEKTLIAELHRKLQLSDEFNVQEIGLIRQERRFQVVDESLDLILEGAICLDLIITLKVIA